MATDYAFLYENYPECVSLDQLYRVCHISKRKAKWLLDNGYIPCHDTGKKTRRYTIRITDIINYLQTREINPGAVSAPIGLFNSKCRKINPIALIDKADFQQYLYKLWSPKTDALTATDIHQLLGYSVGTIGKWMLSKKIQFTQLPDGTKLVAKEWLIAFTAEYTTQYPSNLSDANRKIVETYLTQQ